MSYIFLYISLLLFFSPFSRRLLSNVHQSKLRFESDPTNSGKTFRISDAVLDAKTALSSADSDLDFEYVYHKTKEMHSLIFSIIRDLLECKGTDVSMYDDACFHIFASDIAFDKHGSPYFLEMNTAMGYPCWTDEEQSEFWHGAAALVKGTVSPYDMSDIDTSMWERI